MKRPLSQHTKLSLAITLIREIVASLGERVPAGFSKWQADNALESLRVARAHMEKIEELFQQVERRAAS